MAHPYLLAGGAAALAAVLLGTSKSAHAAAAQANAVGLQPNPAPSGGLFGPTAQPADDSGLNNGDGTYTGDDGNTYASDGSGGVLFGDTDNSASAPAGTPGPAAPPAPSESGDFGTFENNDDTASASAPQPIDTSASDSSDQGVFSDNSGSSDSSDDNSNNVSVPASVSGYYDTGLPNAPPNWTDNQDGTATDPTGTYTLVYDTAWQYAGILSDDPSSPDYGSFDNTDYNTPSAVAPAGAAASATASGYVGYVTNKGGPIPYRHGHRHNPTAGRGPKHSPTKHNRRGAKVGGPTGLVWSDHARGWTHAYPGHQYGAPPPPGLPIYRQ